MELLRKNLARICANIWPVLMGGKMGVLAYLSVRWLTYRSVGLCWRSEQSVLVAPTLFRARMVRMSSAQPPATSGSLRAPAMRRWSEETCYVLCWRTHAGVMNTWWCTQDVVTSRVCVCDLLFDEWSIELTASRIRDSTRRFVLFLSCEQTIILNLQQTYNTLKSMNTDKLNKFTTFSHCAH